MELPTELKSERPDHSGATDLEETVPSSSHVQLDSATCQPQNSVLSKNQQRKLRRHQKVLEHRKQQRTKEREARKQRGHRKRRGNVEKLVEVERLRNALQVGSKVVIDCQYQNCMSTKEQTRFAQQLRRVYSSNRSSEAPLHLYLASLSSDSELFKICCEKNEGFVNYQFDISEKSVLDLFEPRELVYLTPDASSVIPLDSGFEKDKVYVIGGIVDETTTKNITHTFAQGTQISCARLPIEEFFEQGGNGTFKKVLTINQVVDIILEWHQTHNWVAAISKGLPERTGFRPRQSAL